MGVVGKIFDFLQYRSEKDMHAFDAEAEREHLSKKKTYPEKKQKIKRKKNHAEKKREHTPTETRIKKTQEKARQALKSNTAQKNIEQAEKRSEISTKKLVREAREAVRQAAESDEQRMKFQGRVTRISELDTEEQKALSALLTKAGFEAKAQMLSSISLAEVREELRLLEHRQKVARQSLKILQRHFSQNKVKKAEYVRRSNEIVNALGRLGKRAIESRMKEKEIELARFYSRLNSPEGIKKEKAQTPEKKKITPLAYFPITDNAFLTKPETVNGEILARLDGKWRDRNVEEKEFSDSFGAWLSGSKDEDMTAFEKMLSRSYARAELVLSQYQKDKEVYDAIKRSVGALDRAVAMVQSEKLKRIKSTAAASPSAKRVSNFE